MSYTLNRAASVLETNKVLRNTFLLTSLMLLPTALGAWFGQLLGVSALIASSPFLSFIGALIIMTVMLAVIVALRDSATVFLPLTAFTVFMGLIMSSAITHALDKVNGAQVVMMAIVGTAIVTVSCSLYAMVTKRDFSFMGGFLFGALLSIIALSFLNMVVGMPMLSFIISCAALLIFSAYIVYDVQQVVNGGETNYVLASVSLYLDIVNIFMSLLNIFGSDD